MKCLPTRETIRTTQRMSLPNIQSTEPSDNIVRSISAVNTINVTFAKLARMPPLSTVRLKRLLAKAEMKLDNANFTSPDDSSRNGMPTPPTKLSSGKETNINRTACDTTFCKYMRLAVRIRRLDPFSPSTLVISNTYNILANGTTINVGNRFSGAGRALNGSMACSLVSMYCIAWNVKEAYSNREMISTQKQVKQHLLQLHLPA